MKSEYLAEVKVITIPNYAIGLMLQSGIPLSSAKTFLRKSSEIHIADLRKVDSYHLVPEYTWLLGYTENPDRLQRRMETTSGEKKIIKNT